MDNFTLKNLRLKLFLLGLLCALLSSSPVSAQVKYVPVPAQSAPPVVILDEDLRDDMKVDQYTTARTPNHLLIVQANLHNHCDHDLAIQAQTVFMDQYGIALNNSSGDQNAWSTIIIPAHGITYYKSQSLVPQATSFTIRARYIKRPNSDDYK